MELKELLQQFIAIDNALSLCIGTLTAFCEQQEEEQEENTSSTALTVKENKKNMLTIKDCSIRMKGTSYEVRFQKFGRSKSFCSQNLELAKKKMKSYLRELNSQLTIERKRKGPTFKDWSETFLTSYKKLTLNDFSFYKLKKSVELHILPVFAERDITTIKPLEVQDFLSSLIKDGKGRTAETLKTYFNGFFETAITNGLIKTNPMLAVKIPKHYRKHGTALTLEEEKEFISRLNEVPYFKKALLFMLYTGVRVSELMKFTESDLDFEKNTLLIHSTKIKDTVNGKPRTVPIFPKLRAVLDMPGKIKVDDNKISLAFKKICPEHHLHELRHTFTTRCRENGIDNELTSLWTGHTFAGNTTSAVYTHFSYEFQQEQAKKLDY